LICETRNEKRVGLNFPIRLLDFETIQRWECFDADSGKDLATELREYYIPDFSNWKDHDAFETEFSKLLRDLREPQKHDIAGVPKHSDLEPNHSLAKGDGNGEASCHLTQHHL
jgi:hypothetical protein